MLSGYLISRVISTQTTRRSIASACFLFDAAGGQKSSHDQLVEKIRGTPRGVKPSLFRHATSAPFFGYNRPFKSSTSLHQKHASCTTSPCPGQKTISRTRSNLLIKRNVPEGATLCINAHPNSVLPTQGSPQWMRLRSCQPPSIQP